ncbi:MAG: hypothetical protein N7Q72_01520 [Spiroplasma sp. Tabriz.8]|nr:hypothetical protein [Spiroplasma sp. Tabriz.8]
MNQIIIIEKISEAKGYFYSSYVKNTQIYIYIYIYIYLHQLK